MISPTPQTQQAIALVEQLPPNQLAIAITFLEELSGQHPDDETTLRKIIHKAPVIDCDRLNDLRDRNEWETLTSEEYQELLTYEEQLESYNSDRLQAMIHLAELKNIDLPTLNQQIQSETPHAA